MKLLDQVAENETVLPFKKQQEHTQQSRMLEKLQWLQSSYLTTTVFLLQKEKKEEIFMVFPSQRKTLCHFKCLWPNTNSQGAVQTRTKWQEHTYHFSHVFVLVTYRTAVLLLDYIDSERRKSQHQNLHLDMQDSKTVLTRKLYSGLKNKVHAQC